MGSAVTPQDRAVGSCSPLPSSWGQGATCAIQGGYSIVGLWRVPLCRGEIPQLRKLQWLSPCFWIFPKLPRCEQENPNFPNSLLCTIKSLMAKRDFLVWIFCHLWSNSFYLAVSLSVKYFLQVLSVFFPAIQGYLIFCPIPAPLAKINTPAAWKLWISLFCIHSCHPWATIHLLSYLCVSSFRIISSIF